MNGHSQSKRIRSNNLGYSLIELIVTVLIIAVVAGISAMSIQNMYRHDAMAGARKLSASLDRARIEAMSKLNGAVFLRIVRRGEDYQAELVLEKTEGGVVVEEVIDTTILGSTNLSVTARDVLAPTKADLELDDESDVIEIKFIKGLGGFMEDSWTEIIISGSKTATVLLMTETGRSFVE